MVKLHNLMLEQLNFWKLTDRLEEKLFEFNTELQLSEDEERDFERLRKEIDEILENWNK